MTNNTELKTENREISFSHAISCTRPSFCTTSLSVVLGWSCGRSQLTWHFEGEQDYQWGTKSGATPAAAGLEVGEFSL